MVANLMNLRTDYSYETEFEGFVEQIFARNNIISNYDYESETHFFNGKNYNITFIVNDNDKHQKYMNNPFANSLNLQPFLRYKK